ncbi:MAG: glycosyltransferase [Chitinophagaceae bacterium]|nr:glycosyltransferase [Chitinophagaceae bacterium]
MKILILAHEFPYPANHGCRLDIWNRIKALKKFDAEIYLLTWYEINKNDIPTGSEIEVVKNTVDHLALFRIPRDFKRVLRLFKYPSLVAARILKKEDFRNVLDEVIQFNPDFILADCVYSGYTGLQFAKALSVPLCLRSHNVEHLYLIGQFKMTRHLRTKLSILANILHLKKYEEHIINSVDAFFDTSIDDLEFWRSKGYNNGHWLPPVYIEKGYAENYTESFTDGYDVGFIGNLYTPNNVGSLLWFIRDVLPIIQCTVPEVTFLIVGANPTAELLKVCHRYPNIKIIANPEHVEPFIKTTKVLINPLQSGSGVNIKSIEMLFSDKQVVSTSTGVKGIHSAINDAFFIADAPEDFASNIVKILTNKASKELKNRHELRNLFKETSVKKLLSVMDKKREVKGFPLLVSDHTASSSVVRKIK